jgi:hypothetical protein
MLGEEWSMLLRNAAAQWEEFPGILVERSPNDLRMRSLQSQTVETAHSVNVRQRLADACSAQIPEMVAATGIDVRADPAGSARSRIPAEDGEISRQSRSMLPDTSFQEFSKCRLTTRSKRIF